MNTVQKAFDQIDTYFLHDELVKLQNESFKELRSPYNSEMLISPYNDDPEGAKYHRYYMHDSTGEADFVSSLDNTFPMANVLRKSKESPYDNIGISEIITYQDLASADMALLPLIKDKYESCLETIRFKQNRMAFFGAPDKGINGWFTLPDINKQPVTGGAWLTATPKEPDAILDDMNEAVTASMTGSDGLIRVNTLVMPVAQYAHIQRTPRSANSDITILEYFLSNNPGVRVVAANELKGAFTGGTDGMIAYDNNPRWFKQLISVDFKQHPVLNEVNGMKMTFISRVGGCVLVYPETQQFRYGI